MNSVGDSFGLPFRDPQWASKILIQGLIALIPIVGWIALLGWVLNTMDNYAQGRPELAPYGFPLGRGFQLFVPLLVWELVAFLPGYIIAIIGSAIAGASSGYEDSGGGGAIAGGLLALLGYLVILAAGLAFLFFSPGILANVWRDGMGAGFRIGEIMRTAFGSFGNTFLAAILSLVGYLIAGVGYNLCLIPGIFTGPYGAAIWAGIGTWYATQGSRPQSGGPAGYPYGYGQPGYGQPGYGQPGGYPPPPQPPGGGYPTPPPPPGGGGYPPPPQPPPPPPPGGGYPPPPPGSGYPPPPPPPGPGQQPPPPPPPPSGWRP